MRGALIGAHMAILVRRIIPADAGSTCLIKNLLLAHKDHPRGCGEHTRIARL